MSALASSPLPEGISPARAPGGRSGMSPAPASGGPTGACPSLPEGILAARRSIDNIDAAVTYLLAERFKVTRSVGEMKAADGLPPADPQRDAEQIARMKQIATEAGLDPDFAEAFRAFVVAEVIRHHQRIAAEYEAGRYPQAPPPLDTFA